MNNREMMLKQIEATLKQEKDYLKVLDKKLNDPNVTGSAREKVLIFREACINAIDRHEKARLQYV
ncbi:hypothetical protein [Maledivibacter halophilus]|uniref:Uncharacterized protein n=1 Tax=Maledivibacter halophilus TaxID=36842 RepID=A0A1T5KEY4_9FIRM|nr:hypothetical protein [Maledivibacter halophilus]SKC61918.1 hypothetical protein SAMN02194393_01724 [Maledivibacter halophilus]